jgi:hypothetical protein
MKRIIAALALLTVASLSVAGCGDDDDTAMNTAGKGNSAGEPSNNTGGQANSTGGQPASAGETNTPVGGASSGNVMCDPTQAGVCQNPMDCPFVVDGTARMTAGTCGQGCVGKASNCTLDCIQKMLDMSSECATCYADTVNCTIKNCLADCIADPEADVCKQCQVDKGCRSAFDDCSGLPG